jgi:hypothetical protein
MRSSIHSQEHEAMTTVARTTPFNTRSFSPRVHQDHFTLAMHQEAENALAMALHYLRSGGSNLPGATRKAVQALGALNRLEMLSVGSVARTTGRA